MRAIGPELPVNGRLQLASRGPHRSQLAEMRRRANRQTDLPRRKWGAPRHPMDGVGYHCSG